MSELDDFVSTKYGYCYYAMLSKPLIHSLYIEKEYRRKGYSKRLLQYIISEIRATGYSGDIEIVAEPSENSISLEKLKEYYESMGLKVINSKRGAK